MFKKIKFYYHLYSTDRPAFWHQLWMVYNRYRLTMIVKFFRVLSTQQGEFVTIHHRPIITTGLDSWSDPIHEMPKIALVLQGPISTDRNFTIETVRLYKKHFPQTTIIVSTWDNTPADVLTQLKDFGITVITSVAPTVRGLGNVNLQMASTMAGLQAARDAGATFVYKTRTDQRMYGLNLNEFLVNLIHHFPVASPYEQKCRIIASSFLSLKFVPYLITDMWQFGHIDDMLAFWGAPIDTRTNAPIVRTIKDSMDARIAEPYLVTEYMKRLGRPVHNTLADSWGVFADHFCIVDRETLDLFWNKYDLYREYPNRNYAGVPNGQLLTFAEWFNLYTNLKNKADIPERTLTVSRHDLVPKPPTT